MTREDFPWVGWYDRDGQAHLSSWMGDTRLVVVTGVEEPHRIPHHAEVYEVPNGMDAHALAKQVGGIVVIIFDVKERFGEAPRSL